MGSTKTARALRAALLATASASAALFAAGDASALVSRGDSSPTAIRDSNNLWPWVGQMIAWDNRASASFGLCTGQVINPRVVLFAAHCFGGVATGNGERYGTGAGLRDMAFMFNTNNLAALRRWIGFDPSTTPIGASNEADRVYRVIDIIGHPRNALNSFSAGNADVALAVFDQPVADFNGYGILFSPLTALERVELAGYGRTGTMETGQSIAIDWWRRQGENMLSFLGSDNDVFGTPLFGNSPPFPGYNGDLYWMDSDSHINPRPPGDFNIFGGAALPNEVGIAQGDSGGAMWIRRGGVPIAIGVASYGYSFAGAPAANFGRGTITAHTPLFPYWDFIVANNAYVYAAARTGGGAWETASTWVQMLDPNYLTIGAGGAIVNALPTTAPVSDTGAAPNVGGVRPPPATPVPNNDGAPVATPDVAQLAASGEGLAVVTGASGSAGTIGLSADGRTLSLTRGTAADFRGGAQVASAGATLERPTGGDFLGGTALNGADTLDRPDAIPASSGFFPVGTTPLSGPGSTNFVPSNTNGTPGTAFQNAARFFEVQLVNSGTVTLSSARTIDRLRIMAGPAALTINSGASLTTVMSSSIEAGTLTVDGTLRARGIGVFGGVLNGTGLLQATGGTLVSGALRTAGTIAVTGGGIVAPGGTGAVGTLTFEGNVSFAGGALDIDLASATSFDRIVVNNLAGVTSGANGTFTSPTTGTLPVLAVRSLGLFAPTFGQTFDVITAAGGVTGSFSVATALPGVLTATYGATGNVGRITISARPFQQAWTFASPEQAEVARALDAIRNAGGYAGLAGVFNGVDVLNQAGGRTAFQQLAGLASIQAAQEGYAAQQIATNQIESRLDQVRRGQGGGYSFSGLEALGVEVASADAFEAMKIAAAALPAAAEAAAAAPGFSLRPGWGAFAVFDAAVQGNVAITTFAGEADLDAYAVTGGVDYRSESNWYVGGALTLMRSKTSLVFPSIETDTGAFLGHVYAGWTDGVAFVNGYVTGGRRAGDTTRVVSLASGTQILRAEPRGEHLAVGARVGADVAAGDGIVVTPFAGFDWKRVALDAYAETGGSAALSYGAYGREWKEGRVGVAVAGAFDMGEGRLVRPSLSAAWVMNFDDEAVAVPAAFVGAAGTPMTFLGVNADEGYGEIKGGIDFQVDDNLDLGIAYEGYVSRDDVDLGTVSANVSVRW